MDQNIQTKNPISGAAFMIGAGIAFAGINVITQTVTGSADYGGLGFKPTSDAFWQYFIGLIVSLPILWNYGLGALKTQFPMLHIIRVALSGMGVLAFVYGLAHGVQIWQVIALVMTSPFFILLGAKLFLGENVGADRWFAAALGFAGAMVVLQPWSSGFNAWSLAPIAAAVLWGAASLITKKLTGTERAETITMWLLIGIAVWNGAFSIAAGFEWPQGKVLYYLLAGGVIQFLAQWCLTKAYAKADASFLQPFDDLRLPFNVLAGFLAFHYLPEGNLWIGIAMIMAASAFLLWRNNAKIVEVPKVFEKEKFGETVPPKNKESEHAAQMPFASNDMGRAQAYTVLGLKEGSNSKEVRAAYRRLLRANHPDVGGSDYIVSRINQARDILLGQ